MVADDAERALLRRPAERNGRIVPRGVNKPFLPLFLEARRAAYGKADAVNQPHSRACASHADFRTLFGYEFGFGGHHRFPRRRLRQFVRITLALFARYGGKHELLHKPLDERRFARTDGSDDAHENLSARARRNILVYTKSFHKKTPPPISLLEYLMSRSVRLCSFFNFSFWVFCPKRRRSREEAPIAPIIPDSIRPPRSRARACTPRRAPRLRTSIREIRDS